MDGLFNVLLATLIPVSRDVFYHVSFAVTKPVGVDVFHWLDGAVLVMAASDLRVLCGHGNLSEIRSHAGKKM